MIPKTTLATALLAGASTRRRPSRRLPVSIVEVNKPVEGSRITAREQGNHVVARVEYRPQVVLLRLSED